MRRRDRRPLLLAALIILSVVAVVEAAVCAALLWQRANENGGNTASVQDGAQNAGSAADGTQSSGGASGETGTQGTGEDASQDSAQDAGAGAGGSETQGTGEDAGQDAGAGAGGSETQGTGKDASQDGAQISGEDAAANAGSTETGLETENTWNISDWPAGTVVDAADLSGADSSALFVSMSIGQEVLDRIYGQSYVDNPDISLEQLRYLKVLHYNFNHELQVGELIVNVALAEDYLEIFQELYEAEYEIQSMYLIDNYWTGDGGSSDTASIEQNNTSAFCYRRVTGGSSLSNHALGCAIDINPQQNPYVTFTDSGAVWSHSNANAYIDRTTGYAHVITHDDLCYQLFIAHGFSWGGDWTNPKDYQHFEREVTEAEMEAAIQKEQEQLAAAAARSEAQAQSDAQSQSKNSLGEKTDGQTQTNSSGEKTDGQTQTNSSGEQTGGQTQTNSSGDKTDSQTQTNSSGGKSDSQTQTESQEGSASADSADTAQLLSSLTLEEKVAQLFMITPEALTGVSLVTAAGETTRAALEQYPVGGLIYFSENIQSETQFALMVQNAQQYSQELVGLPLLIGVDEEGGTVARISGRGFSNVPEIPDMYSIGSAGDASQAYEIGESIGEYLQRFGVNVDFAPVADVWSNPSNSVIGTRSFGTDASLVADMVAEEVKGLQEQGVSATLKHFPGHGDTEADSHLGTAVSYKTLEELRTCEFLPFEAGIEAGADFVMVGHISLPNVTGDNLPASLSYTVITELLRGELGFDGVVITDAMNMGAVTTVYSSGDAAVLALQSGADLILMPADFQNAYQAVLSAVESGTLTEERIDESVTRILAVKAKL